MTLELSPLLASVPFVVISARVAIDSSLPIASEGPPFRGQKYMRHRGWHPGCLSESCRSIDTSRVRSNHRASCSRSLTLKLSPFFASVPFRPLVERDVSGHPWPRKPQQ
ncbi:hypothetical protein CXR25_05415 [Brevibacterium aurantiacum]|uniref:Uncharacterized protein n=1 Tax=Brevibacterium aurantiacum TaxID=273384 RepID=A0A3S8SHX8_BREAU|nr:hypothetical protein CXR24_05535 [Brevibacterium aurantiacum]AZL12309.1 hypothetical protein CXR25_05415 [Brevibacterium aurantiacum]RCS84154.1 hypothetical protein CIK63_18265 [Brevibacterium aurantiacum]TGD36213.1 hypothetical protein EB834_20410 [Brevibacterium aurantiacum]